ncbi:plastocyanin/azurin family copper-binding protein [Sphingobacterium siyangense]|uniref:plastocyanin/azurin family copper-binding protein n=1 Tax=Sphingobacterium siyangense TaxID=459529 RepID=UPI003C752BCB
MKYQILKKVWNIIGVVASLIILGGCGGDSSDQSNASHGNHEVIIENMAFNPQDLTISKGDTVTFVNKDVVPHNATEMGNIWASPDLKPGDKWQFVPDKTAEYYCTIHVVMEGKINVN